MKAEIETSLIYALIDALKTPHIAIMLGMLGIAALFVVREYVRDKKR